METFILWWLGFSYGFCAFNFIIIGCTKAGWETFDAFVQFKKTSHLKMIFMLLVTAPTVPISLTRFLFSRKA